MAWETEQSERFSGDRHLTLSPSARWTNMPTTNRLHGFRRRLAAGRRDGNPRRCAACRRIRSGCLPHARPPLVLIFARALCGLPATHSAECAIVIRDRRTTHRRRADEIVWDSGCLVFTKIPRGVRSTRCESSAATGVVNRPGCGQANFATGRVTPLSRRCVRGLSWRRVQGCIGGGHHPVDSSSMWSIHLEYRVRVTDRIPHSYDAVPGD
jgi:hypothetical protein